MAETKGLQSIRILRAEDIPVETRVKNNLPDTGFIEVRMERNSDTSPKFQIYSVDCMTALRGRLREKNLLFITIIQ